MDIIFEEKHRNAGALPPDSPDAHIETTVRAVYDDHYGVLVIDLSAMHYRCEEDGTPSGCRFCTSAFPLDDRQLIDLADFEGDGTAVAIRRAVKEADAFYAEVERRRGELLTRGPLENGAPSPVA